MSKVTVITDAGGKIAAIGHGHLSRETAKKAGHREPQGGLFPLPGQRLHELEVPEDLSSIRSFKQLQDKVRPHVAKKH